MSTNIYPNSVQFSRSLVSDSSVHHQLLELAHTHVCRVDDVIQPSHPHPLLLLPSIFPSIRVLSNESALHIRWPKYLSFSFSISPSNEYSAFISFRIGWFHLLTMQGTLKSPLQHHNLKTEILQHLAFFIVQFSHPYMITRKPIALAIQTFDSKVMSSHLHLVSYRTLSALEFVCFFLYGHLWEVTLDIGAASFKGGTS